MIKAIFGVAVVIMMCAFGGAFLIWFFEFLEKKGWYK